VSAASTRSETQVVMSALDMLAPLGSVSLTLHIASTWQAASQPSPGARLPSSQVSPVPTTPSPHTAIEVLSTKLPLPPAESTKTA
jgi:hypothetical protein